MSEGVPQGASTPLSSREGRVRRRWIVFGFVLVILYTAIGALDNSSWIEYYRVIDDRTLVVGTVEGPGAWTRVTRVVETGSTVTISVSSFLFRPWSATAIGVRVESSASLRDPIGSRTVIDGVTSLPVQGTRCLPPAYFAPGCALKNERSD